MPVEEIFDRHIYHTYGVSTQINLSGVIGNVLTRLPVAWYTALATAAEKPTSAISPSPLAPIGSTIKSGLLINTTSVAD